MGPASHSYAGTLPEVCPALEKAGDPLGLPGAGSLFLCLCHHQAVWEQWGLSLSQDPGLPAWVEEQLWFLSSNPLPWRYHISYPSLSKQAGRDWMRSERAQPKGCRPVGVGNMPRTRTLGLQLSCPQTITHLSGPQLPHLENGVIRQPTISGRNS